MTVANLNLRFLTLTSYKSDLENRINMLMSRRQYLTYKSMNLSNAMAQAMQKEDNKNYGYLEQIEKSLQYMDKILEMNEKNLESQQKAVSTEMQSVKKMMDKNIKSEFKAFA